MFPYPLYFSGRFFTISILFSRRALNSHSILFLRSGRSMFSISRLYSCCLWRISLAVLVWRLRFCLRTVRSFSRCFSGNSNDARFVEATFSTLSFSLLNTASFPRLEYYERSNKDTMNGLFRKCFLPFFLARPLSKKVVTGFFGSLTLTSAINHAANNYPIRGWTILTACWLLILGFQVVST